MTRLLEKAVEAARQLPPEEQDEVGRVILTLVGADTDEITPLTPEERAAIQQSMEQADRGEFATEAEIEAIWKKYT